MTADHVTELTMTAGLCGAFDHSLLEVLEDYVRRQRKQLARPSLNDKIETPEE